MQLDQPQLQLIANVVGITAVTSLVLICAILKRDKDKLAAEMKLRAQETALPSAAPASPPEPAPRPSVTANTRQDIRQFVAERARVWMPPSPSNPLTEA
jgi:hypothetical protein